MGSQISFTASRVEIDRFLDELRAASGMPPLLVGDQDDRPVDQGWCRILHIKGIKQAGPVMTCWGRRLTDVSDELWAEAQDEASQGLGSIETIRPRDGSPRFEAILLEGPYKHLVIDALLSDGDPVFDYTSSMTSVSLVLGGTTLELTFDDRTMSLVSRRPWEDKSGVTYLGNPYWHGRDHEATAADHMSVVRVLDLLGQHSDLDVSDSSGYFNHRDEALMVAMMVDDTRMRRELRVALAEYDAMSPAASAPGITTIADILGGPKPQDHFAD